MVENVPVGSLNFFLSALFQEIICQKNTVSTQSHFSLAFAFHTLLNHCWHITHIKLCKEYAFLFSGNMQGARYLTPYASLLSVKKGFLSDCVSEAVIIVWLNIKCVPLYFQEVCFADGSCFSPCTGCLKRDRHLEHLTCKMCSIQISCKAK